VAKVFNSIKETHGKVDNLVNNVGITRDNFIYKMRTNDWEKVMDIHLKVAFLCSKYAQEIMVKKGLRSHC